MFASLPSLDYELTISVLQLNETFVSLSNNPHSPTPVGAGQIPVSSPERSSPHGSVGCPGRDLVHEHLRLDKVDLLVFLRHLVSAESAISGRCGVKGRHVRVPFHLVPHNGLGMKPNEKTPLCCELEGELPRA